MAHELLAVANAQYREAALEHDGIHSRRTLGHDAGGATRQDNGSGIEFLNEGPVDSEAGVDFAVDAGLADAPRDQLRYLRAEVDDEDFFGDGKQRGHEGI